MRATNQTGDAARAPRPAARLPGRRGGSGRRAPRDLGPLFAAATAISVARTLGAWQDALAAAVAGCVPGAQCVVALRDAALPPDPRPAETTRVLPLRVDDRLLGQAVIALPAVPVPDAEALLAHLAQIAALRLAALVDPPALRGDVAALVELTMPVPGALDLPQLVAQLLEQVRRAATAPGAVALLYERETDDWQVAGTAGWLPAGWPLAPAALRDLLDTVRHAGAPVVYHPPAAGDGVRLVVLPLRTDERLVGAFGLVCPAGAPLEARLPILGVLAGRAAVLLHNLQLRLQAEELLILEERTRIARAMHDGLAQSLTHIRMRCELVERIMDTDPERAVTELAEVRADLKEGARELVRVIHALVPGTVGDDGLGPALQRLAEALARPGSREIAVDVPAALPALPAPLALALLRAAQESLRLAMWHLGADRCALRLRVGPDHVALTVEANGPVPLPGDSDAAAWLPAWDRDLALVEARIGALGGTVTWGGHTGAGTQFIVTLPLAPPGAGGS